MTKKSANYLERHRGGEQAWNGVVLGGALLSALTHRTLATKQSIHSTDRAQINSLLQ